MTAFGYIDGAMKLENLSESFTFRVTAQDAVRIKQLADKHERKIADMIRLILRHGLKALERTK